MFKLFLIWGIVITCSGAGFAQAVGGDAPDKAFLSTRHLPPEVTRLSHLRRGEPRLVLLDWFGVS